MSEFSTCVIIHNESKDEKISYGSIVAGESIMSVKVHGVSAVHIQRNVRNM